MSKIFRGFTALIGPSLMIGAFFLYAGEKSETDGVTAGSLLETVISDIGSIVQNSGNMGPADTGAIVERISGSWKAFSDTRAQDPWYRDPATDSIAEAAGSLLAQASADFEKKGAVGAYSKVLPLLEMLVSEYDKPVLADFTGAQCKVCKIMKARLAKIEEEYSDRVRIVLVNVNTEKGLTRQYQIMLIPTLVFIDRSGKEIFRNVGEMEEKAVKTKLDELLKE